MGLIPYLLHTWLHFHNAKRETLCPSRRFETCRGIQWDVTLSYKLLMVGRAKCKKEEEKYHFHKPYSLYHISCLPWQFWIFATLKRCSISYTFSSYSHADVDISCAVDDAGLAAPHNPRLSVVLLIAIQNTHEYFMLWRSHPIPRFLRRLG